jgi:hypothetical protein
VKKTFSVLTLVFEMFQWWQNYLYWFYISVVLRKISANAKELDYVKHQRILVTITTAQSLTSINYICLVLSQFYSTVSFQSLSPKRLLLSGIIVIALGSILGWYALPQLIRYQIAKVSYNLYDSVVVNIPI